MLLARAARAQTPAPHAAAADAVTATDIARHIGVMVGDSMQGRDTPSPALERTARYVAEQFQAVGLVPMGDSGGWVQRYPVPGHSRVDLASFLFLWGSTTKDGRVVLSESGELVRNFATIDLRSAAILATDTVLDRRAPGAVGGGQVFELDGMSAPAPVVLAGAHTVASVRQAGVHDKVVVYVPDTDSDSALQQQIITVLRASNHVIVVVTTDSAGWAARRRAAEAHRAIALDWYLAEARSVHRWVVHVWAPRIDGALARAGFDLAAARASHAPVVREIAAGVFLDIVPATADLTAPNILGLLPGSEPGQALVLTAHIDQAGPGRGRAHAQTPTDRVAGGMDDNAVGVAGLLALAKAFKAAGVQPRRSIVFAAVSGGANEFWGSSCLIAKWRRLSAGRRIAMNLNLDAIGPGTRDSLRIDGVRDVELPVSPVWLAASRPELHLTVTDGGTAVAPESDHFAFVRQRIPSLYLHAGPRRVASEAMSAPLDPDQAAHLLRFVFALTQELANAPRAPRWTAEGREQLRRVFGD